MDIAQYRRAENSARQELLNWRHGQSSPQGQSDGCGDRCASGGAAIGIERPARRPDATRMMLQTDPPTHTVKGYGFRHSARSR